MKNTSSTLAAAGLLRFFVRVQGLGFFFKKKACVYLQRYRHLEFTDIDIDIDSISIHR